MRHLTCIPPVPAEICDHTARTFAKHCLNDLIALSFQQEVKARKRMTHETKSSWNRAVWRRVLGITLLSFLWTDQGTSFNVQLLSYSTILVTLHHITGRGIY